MGAAEKLEVATEAPWVLRPFGEDPRDEEAMHYLLGVAYTRSRAGQRAGASRAGRRGDEPNGEMVIKQRAFLAAMSPVWSWLLDNATVTLAVDPEQRHIVWGWAITSEPNVVHAVGVKRSVIDDAGPDVAQDLVRDLLGHRLDKHQVLTLELPQMRVRGDAAIGIDRPREWSLDPVWLLTRMVGR
jgi:hypothetical protein